MKAVLDLQRRLPLGWVALVTVALCVASEYKFRTRAVDQTINGKVDPFIVFELGVYAIVGALLFWILRSPPRLRSTDLVATTRWIYVAVLTASVTYAAYPSLAAARAGELVVSAAFVQTVQGRATQRHLRVMARSFLGLVSLSVLLGLVHRFPHPRDQEHRFTWLYVHPINAANFLGIAAILSAALWLRSRRLARLRHPRRWGWSSGGYVILFLIFAAALVGTRTRMATAATALALLVYALLMTRVHRKRIDLLLVLGLGALAVLIVAAPQLSAFVSRGEGGAQLASLNRRTQLWSDAFDQIGKSPLFGHGIGSSHGLFLNATGLGGAHNGAIGVLTDAGAIGCLAWIVFLGVVLIGERRLLDVARGPMQAPLLLALSTFLLVNSITTDGLGAAANAQQLMFFLISAWVVVLARETSTVRAGQPRGPTRILAIHPVADRYGSDKAFVNTLVAMRRSGFEVSVMIAEGGPLERKLEDLGFPTTPLRTPVLRKRLLNPVALFRFTLTAPRLLLSLARTFHGASVDLVYVNTLTLPHCVLAARLACLPVVCHVRELESSIPRFLSRTLTFPILFSTRVIANSAATEAHLRSDWRRFGNRATVVYNGIEPPVVAPARPDSIRTIGVVGRLSPRKGQDIAIRAVAGLLGRGLDLELVLVGDCFPGYEWYEGQLREAASAHPGRIRLLGYRADAWEVYRGLDLVLVPSRLEPFGNVAVEAALAARPVIAAKVGGLPEIVRDGRTGILVEPDDPEAFAAAIESLVEQPARAYELAAEASVRARLQFSPREAEDRLAAILRRAWGADF